MPPVKRKRSRATSRTRKSFKNIRGRRMRAKRSYRGRSKFQRATGRGTRLVMYNKLLQPKVRTVLTYCDTKTLAADTGAVHHIYKLNTLDDPDVTGGGHQPAYRDQWAALYGKYRVTGCKWTLRWSGARGASAVNFQSGGSAITESHPVSDDTHYNQTLLPGIVNWEIKEDTNADFTDGGDLNFIRETGKKMTHVDYRMTGSSPAKVYTMKGQVNFKRFYKDPTNAGVSTVFGVGPTHPVYLHLGKMSKDGGMMGAYKVDLRLQYFVELSEPANIGES